MLKVFWVEDDAENIDEYTNDEFEKLFGTPIVPSSFEKTFETLEDNLVYDFVIIDIDLSKFSDRIYLEQLKNKDFPATNDSEDNYNSLRPDNAGLFVFNKLLEKGFPKERILFLTANAGSETNTYDKFYAHFRNSLIPLPDYVLKDVNGASKLVGYLKKNTRKDLILRRGIIESCLFLKELIKDDDNIQLREFIKIEKNQPAIEITVTEIKNYLDTLSQCLPIRQSVDLNIQYRLFLRTLSHEWEENIEPKWLKDKKNKNDIFTYAWLMKMTRNWVSHAKLLEPLNAQLIAFLFLVNMRAMFKLPKERQYYEHSLLGLISKYPVKDIKIDDVRDNIKYAEQLVDEHAAFYKISTEKHFGEKINEIYRRITGNPDAEKYDFKQSLLQYFWVNQKQEENLKIMQANSDDLLPTLARHIYNDSFPKA